LDGRLYELGKIAFANILRPFGAGVSARVYASSKMKENRSILLTSMQWSTSLNGWTTGNKL